MKATKAEIAQRVEEVLRIRLDGAEMHDIVQYASEKQWNVGERQLWNYVAASDKLLAVRQEKDRGKLFARHVAQRRALYARALNAADFRTALAIVKDEAELQGLYGPKKIAPTDPTGEMEHGAPQLTPEQRARAIKGILEHFGFKITGGPDDGGLGREPADAPNGIAPAGGGTDVNGDGADWPYPSHLR